PEGANWGSRLMKNAAIFGFARSLISPCRSDLPGPSAVLARAGASGSPPRQAARSDWKPRWNRYAAPAYFKIRKAGSDAAMSPAMPRLAATVHTARPSATPAAVHTPLRRPPENALRTVRTVSGPGVQITTTDTPMKAISVPTIVRVSVTTGGALDRFSGWRRGPLRRARRTGGRALRADPRD